MQKIGQINMICKTDLQACCDLSVEYSIALTSCVVPGVVSIMYN